MTQDRSLEQFLEDMRDTAIGISSLVKETDRETFLGTPTGSWAIERGVIQLGEIATQMRARFPEYLEANPELDPPGMRAARNAVVHGYATIVRERVWEMALEGAPAVGRAAEAHLRHLRW